MNQQNLIKIFKALANENRLKILETISNASSDEDRSSARIELSELSDEAVCCVEEIVDRLTMAQSSASQHLKELYNAGLLQREKKAQWVYYTVDGDLMQQLIDYLNQFLPRV